MFQAKLVTIDAATPADYPAILALLAAANLPQEGLQAHLQTALVARAGEQVVGSAALECYGPVALLRSVAVAETERGRGLGQRLIRTIFQLAREQGVSRLYLLTETAADYFPRFGFHLVERRLVPPAVRNSLEFTGLCPDSALAMEMVLAA